jgi:circadian clock protein KaiC
LTAGSLAKTVSDLQETRIATGIPNLDEMLEGGYPAGSLITLSGRPGTGKTIFGSQFLYHGAVDHGQPGMYVSMLEGRRAYMRNMARLGYDFEAVERNGQFRFLEMPTMTAEALPTIWEEIVRNVEKYRIVRLVIDSYTAMAQAFQTQGDLRVFTHTLLGRIVGSTGCTTLMIAEKALPETQIGYGVEEYIADGVIAFLLVPVAGDARIRYIEVTKMRGTNHQMGPIPIEIGHQGIVVRHPHVRGRV